MAKKKKKNQEEELFDRIQKGNYKSYEGGITGTKSTGPYSLNIDKKIREEYEKQYEAKRQAEINEIQSNLISGASRLGLNSSFKRILNQDEERNIFQNVNLYSYDSDLLKNSKNTELKVGEANLPKENPLLKNYQNNVAFAEYMTSDDVKEQIKRLNQLGYKTVALEEAPKEQTKYFKSADGNVVQNVLGTIGDTAVNTSRGFLEFVQGITQWGGHAVADYLDLIGLDEWSHNVHQYTNRMDVGAIYGDNYDNTKNFFERQVLDDGTYGKSWSEKLDQYSYFDKGMDNVAKFVGQQGAIVGSFGLLEGAGVTAKIESTLVKAGVPEQIAVRKAQAISSSLVSYSSAYGSTYSELMNAGYSQKEAKGQARIAGIVEAVSEQLHDGIPGTKTEGWADAITDKFVNSRALKTVFNALGETDEEIFGSILTTAINEVYKKLDTDNQYLNENYSGNFLYDVGQNSESLDDLLGVFIGTLITGTAQNIGTNINARQIVKEYAKENNISEETAEKRLGLQISADNEITSKRDRLINDVYNIVGDVSPSNKVQIEELLKEIPDRKIKDDTALKVASLFNEYKKQQMDTFQDSALNLFPNLDENSKALYYNLLNDISKVIYNNNIMVEFDPNLDVVSEWDGKKLVLNPTLTDTPIKTLLLKELGTELLDNNAKKSIIKYAKEIGVYDTLKQELLDSEEFDSTNVNNEIVSRVLNDILQDQQKLEQVVNSNNDLLQQLKDNVNGLVANITNNRNTKDALFLKEIGNNINSLKLEQNNISGKELTTREIDNIEKMETEGKTKNQIKENPQTKEVQKLQIDTSKYTGTAKTNIDNAINSGLFNNQGVSKEFVENFIGKILGNRGLEVRYADTKQMKKDGVSVKDGFIESYIDGNVITVNTDLLKTENKTRTINSLLGHELLHALKQSQYYDSLKNSMFKYADTIGVLDNKRQIITDTYNKAGIKNVDIDEEVLADLVGDHLFTDKTFINQLANDDAKGFQKIFKEMKRLWIQLTGTKEQKELSKTMKIFNDIYREKFVPKVEEVKYSLNEMKSAEKYGYDTKGRKLSQDVLERNKNSVLHDDKGALIPVYNTMTQIGKPFTVFAPNDPNANPDFDSYKFGDDFVVYTTPNKEVSGSYAGGRYTEYMPEISKIDDLYDFINDYDNTYDGNKIVFGKKDGKYTLTNEHTDGYNKGLEFKTKNYDQEKNVSKRFAYKEFHDLLVDANNSDGSIIYELLEENVNKRVADFEDAGVIQSNNPDPEYVINFKTVSRELFRLYNEFINDTRELNSSDIWQAYTYGEYLTNPNMNVFPDYLEFDSEKEMLKYLNNKYSIAPEDNYQYEMYANITNPYEYDFKGRNWRNNEDPNYVDKKMRSLLEPFARDDADAIKLQYRIKKLAQDSIKEYDKLYHLTQKYYIYDSAINDGLIYRGDMYEGLAIMDLFDSYDDFLESPFAEYFPKADEHVKTQIKSKVGLDVFNYRQLFDNYIKYKRAYNRAGEMSTYFNNNVNTILEDLLDDSSYENVNVLKSGDTLYKFALDYDFNLDNALNLYSMYVETNDIVKEVLKMNKNGANYDGVWIKNVEDPGHSPVGLDKNGNKYIKHPEWTEPVDLFIAFSPEQLKSVYNEHPTDDVDINFSLQQQREKYGDYNVTGEDLGINPLLKNVNKTTKNTNDKLVETGNNKSTESKVNVASGEKTRKTYQSIIDSDNQTEEAKTIARNLMGLDTYIPDSNQKQIERADETINKYGVEQAFNNFKQNVDNGKINVDDNAIGERLIQYFSKIGDEQNLQDAIQYTAMAGTISGRSLQAMAMINRQSPTGQVTWIQRSIDRINKQMQEQYDKSKNPFKKLQQFDFTPEMQQKILNADESNMDNVLSEVYKELGKQVTMTGMEKFDAWRYFAMLSAPTTHIRNIVGNLTMGKMQSVKNKIRGGLEDIYYGVTGKDGERTSTIKFTPKKYLEYAKKDIDNVKGQLGFGENKYLSPKSQLEQNKKMFNNKVLETVIKKGAIDTTSKLLEVEDIWGLKSAYKKSLAQYLYANKIDLNNITDEQLARARKFAVDSAKQATFHQDNALATALNNLENKNFASKVVLGGTVPFKKTPFNIAKTALEYNPIGLGKTLIADSYKLYNGKITANQYIDNISKGLTGTGIALLGYALAQAGLIRTSGDDDEQYDEDKGIQPYSIVLGDKTISLDWLSPTAVPLFVGAELQRQYEQRFSNVPENERLSLIDSAMSVLDAGVSSLNPVSEMTMLSGIQSALRTYTGDYSKALEQIGTNTIKNYASQSVPSILGKVARISDEYERSTTSTKASTVEKAIDQFINSTKSKIPGLRQTLPVKTDVWGNEIKQDENIGTRALLNLVSPAIVKDVRDTKLDKEIERLYDSTGESSVLPKTYITKKFTYNNKDYNLDNNEYASYKQIFGKDNYKKLNDLINSTEYKNLTDAEKVKVISNIYSYDRDALKVAYAKKHNISYQDNSYKTVKEVEELGGNVVEYYLYNTNIDSKDTTYQKRGKLRDLDISNETKSAIYEASASKSTLDLYKVLKESNIDINDYLDYLSKEFSADEDKNGNYITGSKKKKVYDYMNNYSNLTLEQKILILGRDYAMTNSEKNYIANRINNSSLTTDEKLELYKSMTGFKVSKDGTVRW